MGSERTCYVIMPFDERYYSTYAEAIRPAVTRVSELRGERWRCVRADDVRVPGSITKEIITSLHTADVVIADLTANNPNVLYELGVAHSGGRTTIMITQDFEALPFDVNTYRVHPYDPSKQGLQNLREYLSDTIADVLTGRMKMTNPVRDHAPLQQAEMILNLKDVTEIESRAQQEVWLIEPSLDTDLKMFGSIIKNNILERGIRYRYLVPRTAGTLRQYRRFVAELEYDADAHDTLEVRTVEPYFIESEVVVYDPYTGREEVMIMSPRELEYVFWYRVGKTRGEEIRDRFEILWETVSKAILADRA